MDWINFYTSGSHGFQKISIPTYPLEKRRCWFQLPAPSTAPTANASRYSRFSDVDQAFLNFRLAETPDQVIYSVTLDPATSWLLKNHRVMGEPTLVGTAYYQMISEAAKQQGVTGPFEIKDLFIHRPLRVGEDKTLEVLALVEPGEGNLSFDFKLTGKDDNDMNGEWVTYASGRVGVVSGCTGAGRTQDSPLRSERLDLDAIMSRCGEVVKHDHQTPSTVEGGLVEVGPRWHCLRKVWKGDGERLGFFELDAEFHGDLEIYALHPPLLDAALHLGLEEQGYLPMACGSAKVFGSTPAGLYSWVKLVNNPGDETPAEVLQFDITLAAPDGTIIAVLEGYTVKRVRPGAGMDATVPDSGSLFHQLRWIETPLVSEPGEVVEGKTVALLGGSELLRREVREEILQTGGSVIESDMESAVSLVSRLEEDGVDGLLFLEPLNINMNYSSPEELPLEVAESVEVSFYRFFRFIQAVMRGGVGRRLDILTVACGTYNVTGAEPFLLPENALLSGLGKVIGQEAPNLRCRFLDMDGEPGVTAAQLVKELFNISDDTDYQAAYREGVRYVEELSGLEVSSSSVNTIKDGGVYLITGAFGGIGMEMARHFSSRHHVKLALLGRSRRYLPEGRDLWRGILEKGEDAKVCRNIQMVLDMESSGSEVMLLTADVSEEEQLEPVLEGVRRQWGGIDGIVHCAGVAGDGFLINKDEDSISDVLKPKVRGTRLLDRLTRVDQPGFMVLCSSLTALTGAPGQGDYTAANAFLDAFAAERGRVGLRTLSINWPAWSEVGMAVDHNALGNGPALGTEEALNNLDILLSTPNLPSSVILMKSFSGVQGAVFQKSPLVAEGKEDGNYSETETLLASVWGQVLGYDRISIYDNFYDLGGDSMNALEIRNLVSREMGMDISIADIFTHLTIAQMSSFLEGKRNSQETSAIVLGIRPSKSGEERPYYPLSPAQRRLYIFWKLAKETTAYNLPTALVVRGEVDHRRLEQAFRQLIRHHESLRTGFEHNGDQLVQVIVPSSGVDFFLHRREVSEERIEGYVKSFSRPFDLSKAPLLRAELVRSGERELLLFDVHHIAADAMSLEIMVSHLMRFYLGEELPFPSVHYRDFALWQEELLESGEVDRQKTYWLKQFETLPPPLDMPLDFPRPPVQTFAGAVSGFAVGAETAAGVRRMAVEAGTTPFTVYLSAFFILLYKFSRTEDIVIAVAESGRTDPLVKDMVGMFINNLAVRAFPLAEQEVLAFLNELKHVTLQSYAHQQYPFDALIQELDLPRDLSRNPLTDVTFSYMNFDQAEPGTEGLTFAPYPGQLKDSSKFDMAIFARETAGDVYFSIEYYSAIFTAETMERFGRYYLEVLKQMAADLSHSIGHLELMPHEERLHLLDTFNDTSAQYPADKTIHGLFEEQVERTPDKLAVLGNRVSVTYRMLNEKSGQLARTLAARGVQPDTIVGIMMERSADMVAGIIGILKSGGAYLPIDPGYPQERVDFMLRDSGTKIIVSNGLMVRKTKPGDGNELPNQQTIKPTNRQTNLAYIIYTSGSTGKPKGVMVEHKSITNLLFALNKNYPFGPGDTYLLKTSFVFDVSVSELFGWFMGGGRLAVLESGDEKDPRSILEAVKVFSVTHINFVPTAFNGFIDLLNAGNAGQLPG
ncbi:MAG: SDR family NAD(P)-dependent oxidoreductase, partial [bacterium]|nr:SDR family NAD(P)-dependent oxidoreductase [bacterium]